jgi:FtsH-binding integral membrane protein
MQYGNANGIDKKVDKVEGKDGSVSLWTYALGQVIPLLTGTQILAATLVVFVPLVSGCYYLLSITPHTSSQTGRIGSEAPAEYIIASIVAVLGSYTLSLTTPFFHRFGPSVLRKAVIVSLLVVGVSMAVFAKKDVFDRSHQKRLFVLHKEDVSGASLFRCKES